MEVLVLGPSAVQYAIYTDFVFSEILVSKIQIFSSSTFLADYPFREYQRLWQIIFLLLHGVNETTELDSAAPLKPLSLTPRRHDWHLWAVTPWYHRPAESASAIAYLQETRGADKGASPWMSIWGTWCRGAQQTEAARHGPQCRAVCARSIRGSIPGALGDKHACRLQLTNGKRDALERFRRQLKAAT